MQALANSIQDGAIMPDRAPHILICSCEDTMPLDSESVKRGCRAQTVSIAPGQMLSGEGLALGAHI